MVNRLVEVLRRWEEIEDPPCENRIAEARRDIGYLAVELVLASKIINQIADADWLPDHLWAAHEAACAYVAERDMAAISTGQEPP